MEQISLFRLEIRQDENEWQESSDRKRFSEDETMMSENTHMVLTF